ncbi:MAG: hypothetical protein CMK09_05645 [Ponticaulis sp.]|nr:hypothetical protein [Ponticaulis sp.]
MFNKIIGRVAGVVFVVAGVSFSSVMLEARSDYIAFEKTAEPRTGMMVALVRPEYTTYESRDMAHPIVRYENLEGETVQKQLEGKIDRSEFQRGETIKLLLAPCPSGEDCEIRIDGAFQRFARKYLGVLLSFTFIVVGALMIWKPPSGNGGGPAGGV